MGSESDTFMFDVTNGIHSLHGLEFVFEIIPKVIPLDVQNFVVIEGGHKQITGIPFSIVILSRASGVGSSYRGMGSSAIHHFVYGFISKVIPSAF